MASIAHTSEATLHHTRLVRHAAKSKYYNSGLIAYLYGNFAYVEERDMKDSGNKDKHVWNSAWMEKLDKAHVVYAAKEAYTSYDMYMRIIDMRKCLLPQNGQGCSRNQRNGKRHCNDK